MLFYFSSLVLNRHEKVLEAFLNRAVGLRFSYRGVFRGALLVFEGSHLLFELGELDLCYPLVFFEEGGDRLKVFLNCVSEGFLVRFERVDLLFRELFNLRELVFDGDKPRLFVIEV